MTPYIAIIKDSFREAFASRLLWVLLAAITLFLLVLAPISLSVRAANEFQFQEMLDGRGLINAIRQADADGVAPGNHLWSLFDAREQAAINEVFPPQEGGERGRRGGGFLLARFNQLIKDPKFYDKDVWGGFEFDDDLKKLVERTDLTEVEAASRNRQLLAAAYPQFIELGSAEAVYLGYFGFSLDFPLPIPPEQRKDLVQGFIATVTSTLLGVLGVFISILVTASIIPRTFEPGEITRLLSKPISRSLLFLTKFVGGCAFTFVNVAYFLVGLWLLAGVKFSVWNHKLLLCIPVYLFLFAIYYAVSAWAGALWRNAILSVCVTILFWFVLFVVATIKNSLEDLHMDTVRIREVVSVGDDILMVNGGMDVNAWDADVAAWQPVFQENQRGGPPAFARRFAFAGTRFLPLYDKKYDRLIALPPSFGNRGANRIVAGTRETFWQRAVLGESSEPLKYLFLAPDGRTLGVGVAGVFDLFAPPEEMKQEDAEVWESMKGLVVAPGTCRNLNPPEMDWLDGGFVAAMQPASGALALLNKDELLVLQPSEDGAYKLAGRREIEDPRAAVMAFGQRIVITFEDGETLLIDPAKMTDSAELTLFRGRPPRVAMASPNGRWLGVLGHHRELWLYDCAEGKLASTRIPGQGDVSAAAFDTDNQLLVADRYTRVRAVHPDSGDVVLTYAPSLGITAQIYRWGVMPVYTLLPKPGELDNLVKYLVTDEQTEVAGNERFGETNLNQARASRDLWLPLWSNAAFLAVILGLTCLMISRRDF